MLACRASTGQTTIADFGNSRGELFLSGAACRRCWRGFQLCAFPPFSAQQRTVWDRSNNFRQEVLTVSVAVQQTRFASFLVIDDKVECYLGPTRPYNIPAAGRRLAHVPDQIASIVVVQSIVRMVTARPGCGTRGDVLILLVVLLLLLCRRCFLGTGAHVASAGRPGPTSGLTQKLRTGQPASQPRHRLPAVACAPISGSASQGVLVV